jgi:putative peptide zinc metalloprotease protein
MSAALLSPHWHRVAGLKPRLVPDIRVRRQRVRGETWIVLSARGGGRSVRMDRAAWQLAGRLDGQTSVQALWDAAEASAVAGAGDGPGAEPPTQDEFIDLLAQLREAALLQFERGAHFDRLLPHLDRRTRPAPPRGLLAWRVRLADPSALLQRLDGLSRLAFSRPMAWIWLAALASTVLLALQHAGELWAHGERWLATPRYALLAALLYVPTKALHELAHALALQRLGCRVPEAGVTFMLGLPVPYVDAGAAAGLVRRRDRALVGAAGMAAELLLAALALPAWLLLGDGLARDVAFVTLLITGVSTLLFNANPLQRLDGYFIATDVLDLPNLAPRSRQWWNAWLQRRLLGAGAAADAPASAPGETGWLVAYAPLAWLTTLAVGALAVGWLASVAAPLGAAAALLLGWQLLLRPVGRQLGTLLQGARASAAAARHGRRRALGLLVAALLVAALPLPERVLLQGVVWPQDDAQLRADEAGFVAEVHLGDGARVEVGSPVLQLHNPRLQAELERQQAKVDALEVQLYRALPLRDRPAPADTEASAGDADAELVAARAALAHLQHRHAALTVRAASAGVLALPQAADLAGRYLERGALLGHVDTGAAPTVRAVLPAAQAEPFAPGRPALAASVRLASARDVAWPAQVQRDAGGAQRRLPSAALADRHGGPIATDPRDPQAQQALQPVVWLDVRLQGIPALGAAPRLGERAWVRIHQGHAPLALQAAAGLRRLLSERFHAPA